MSEVWKMNVGISNISAIVIKGVFTCLHSSVMELYVSL